MPVIKSAIKKMRQDKKREKTNDDFRAKLERAIRNAEKTKSGKAVVEATSLVDRAAKNNIIHKNKASRIKSQLSKLSKPATSATPKKTATQAKPAPKATKTPAKKASKSPAKK